jgi:hypothetical protein
MTMYNAIKRAPRNSQSTTSADRPESPIRIQPPTVIAGVEKTSDGSATYEEIGFVCSTARIDLKRRNRTICEEAPGHARASTLTI